MKTILKTNQNIITLIILFLLRKSHIKYSFVLNSDNDNNSLIRSENNDNISRRKKADRNLIEKKKDTLLNTKTKLSFDDYNKMLIQNQSKLFIEIQNIFLTLVYMFSQNSISLGIYFFSIVEDLLAQKREFIWSEFLFSYKILNKIENLNDKKIYEIQIAFLSAFLSNQVKINSDITFIFTPYPCDLLFYHPNFNLDLKNIDKPFPFDLRIIINPKLKNFKTPKKEKYSKISVSREILTMINKFRRESSIYVGKNISSLPSKKLEYQIRSLLVFLSNYSFGKKNFIYKFVSINLKELCKILNLENYFLKSRMKDLEKDLTILMEFFSFANLGYILFKKPLKNNSNIIVEINSPIVNNESWFENCDKPFLWLHTESYIYKAMNKNSSLDEILNKLLHVLNSYTSSKFYDSSVVEKAAANVLLIEDQLTTNDELIKSSIKIEKVFVYTERTTVKFNQKMSSQSEKKIFTALTTFQKKSDFICKFVKKFANLDAFLFQQINFKMTRDYVNFQIKFLELINIYFEEVTKTLESDDEKFVSQISTYFDKKFSLMKNYINKNKKDNSSSWYDFSYYFPRVFPEGYDFSSFKQKKKTKKIETFISRMDRLEERRPEKNNLTKTSIITFPKAFRKSFQANLADELFSRKFYAVDIDMSGLHMNLMLCFLSKKPDYVVNWDKLYEEFLPNLSKSSQKFVKINKIDRSFIKQFFLAILNGRILLHPTRFISYDEFKTFEQDSKFIQFCHDFHDFIQNHSLYNECVEFQNKVSSLNYFLGASFPETDLKGKINIIFQALESILLITLVYDFVSSNCIIHSLERDGLVIFLTQQQLNNIKTPLFSSLVKNVFQSRIQLSIKVLGKRGTLSNVH